MKDYASKLSTAVVKESGKLFVNQEENEQDCQYLTDIPVIPFSWKYDHAKPWDCLLYTSDAADE